MKKILSSIFSALIVLCAFSSCEKEVTIVDAEGITITPAKASVSHHGVTTLTATVSPDNATSKAITWTTKDKSIATVSKYGVVEGIKPGTTTITATTNDGKFSATCEVTVTAIAVTGVTLDKTSAEVVEDESFTLTATVAPANASVQDVTWKSSDETVATVDETGKVTGKTMGKANITVTTKDGGKTATCAVTVKVREPKEVEQVEIWKTDVAGYRAILGDNSDKTTGFLKYSAKDKVVTWEANTTGKPRTATIEFTNGSKLTVTQIEPKDFAGSWNVKSRLFNPNSGRTDKPKGTTSADISAVTLSVVNGTVETLDGHKNSMELKGLYHDATMKVAFDINYEDKAVKMGLFYDRRTTQLAKEGVYCAFIPELESGAWSGYNFAPAKFGANDCNYEWLWLTGEDFDTFRYIPHTQHTFYGTTDMMICGISIVIGTTSDPAALGTSYNTIYQANYNGSNTEGLSISR